MHSVLLLLSFLLLSHGGAAGASDVVVDYDGDEVKAGQLYYVLPVGIGIKGLSLGSLEESCPLYVVSGIPGMDHLEPKPLAFFPENSTEDTVREGDTLFIKFFRPTTCAQSSVWNYHVGSSFVGTGGTTTPPARGPNYSRFAIFKSEEPHEWYNTTYYFKSCPCGVGLVSVTCSMGCGPTLGLDDFERHHVLSGSGNDVAYWFFDKVKEGAMGSKIRPVASRTKA